MQQPDRLYDLLPAIHRLRDQEQGFPLRALLRVMAEQAQVIEEDIRRLYDDWFIDTCSDWAVPYIADLVGLARVDGRRFATGEDVARAALLESVLVPRQEVGNVIRFRRRKGTLALLELLAEATAGLPARAVEAYRLLAWTQHVNHVHLDRPATVDVRQGDRLDRVDGPFDGLARSVDVRRVSSRRTPGFHNLPSVGVFAFRQRAYSVTRAPAYCLDRQPNCYTFSILGNDGPLYTRPVRDEDPTEIAGPLALPVPIGRRSFGVRAPGQRRPHASPAYYGEGKSLVVYTYGWPKEDENELVVFPAERVIAADLTDFRYAPPAGHIAVDPVLGRLAFPIAQPPDKPVHATYHYGFAADLGGGEYERPLFSEDGAEVFQVWGQEQWEQRLGPWHRRGSSPPSPRAEGPRRHVIEIMDSGVYEPPFRLEVPAGDSLQIRAASGRRPVLFIPERRLQQLDDLSITLGAGAELTLDGLLIVNRGVTLRTAEGDEQRDPCRTRVRLRHVTLVPGWAIDSNCRPLCPTEPSLVLVNLSARVTIERSILGSIQVEDDEVREDPSTITLTDSVLDATGSDCESPDCEAIGRLGRGIAHAVLEVIRSTVIGRVRTHAIELGEDSIFTGRVSVARTQRGCLRHCYVPPGSRTPRRYRCQPDSAELALREADDFSTLPAQSQELLLSAERGRVAPEHVSRRYGSPLYCRLLQACAPEILRGAGDEGEMGVFHDLFEPQRMDNLRARLAEYTPAATDADVIVAS
jgi:hypothetical protein